MIMENAKFTCGTLNLGDTSKEVCNLSCKTIENVGRTCYQSVSDFSVEGAERFVRNLIKNGHEAMLEHESLTVRFYVDRGVTHEIVRHRLMSFAMESTRYCNYSKTKFGSQIQVIKPFFLEDYGLEAVRIWVEAMKMAEKAYMDLLKLGMKPEEARGVLPMALKTEIVVTANLREWRHFLKLRAAGYTGTPHPQMAEVAIPLLAKLQKYMPAVFEDIEIQDCVKNTEWGKKIIKEAYGEDD